MGRHALHLAAEANSTAAVRFLLTDAGVDVNLQTVVARDTALHFAAKVCHTRPAIEHYCLLDISLRTVTVFTDTYHCYFQFLYSGQFSVCARG